MAQPCLTKRDGRVKPGHDDQKKPHMLKLEHGSYLLPITA
jgi:hypothetical protein